MSDTFVGSVRKEDTIYRNGVVPDKSFQIDINFAKMESVSGTSSIFHVSYYGKPRVLKVILGTPTIIFEIWTALVARSEHIALLNGPSYAMLVSCQISMVLCSLSTQPTVLISTPFGMTKVFHVMQQLSSTTTDQTLHFTVRTHASLLLLTEMCAPAEFLSSNT
ncbi:hypothetical protein N7489_008797 [Penicillium chrysogenum]|uniref:Uncharacterized protein n=1 Tax=Penicillium chrysogenum TaxID=5076 RepID=A0ABQ8WZ07_PENCH|nr:uncharacterized protein N7489_008797 [Penicillium chrysogenum]KAJ5228089.1 hypothetical protein N7489_008797 [Penicillium chrysogenum]KAJ5284279.1 hypothetical protein N7505_002259 [Penicillium chrysogenum]KAJ6167596.1 hypothetical protein N7497_000439 [Penicillium chrysogenum]